MTNEIKLRIEQINRGEIPQGYKKTEVGIVPQEWEETTLSELFVFKNGLNKEKEAFGNGTPIVNYTDVWKKRGLRASDVNGKVTLTEKEIENYNVKKGDVFFTRTSETKEEIGLSSVLLEDIENGVFSGFVLRARPKTEKIFSPYNQYCYSSALMRHEVIKKSSITTRALTSGASLGQVQINLPSYEEQQHISEILSKWDDAISLQEELIHKMEIYKELLLKALLEPKTDWKKLKIEQVATKQKAKLAKTIVNGIYPIIDMEYLEKQQFVNFTNDVGIMCTKEDVLLLWDGSGAGTPIYNVSGVVGSTFAKLTPNDEVLSGFLYYFLLNIKKKNSILREGSGVPHVPKDFMKMQYIYLPTIDSQKRIVQILETYDATIRKQLGKLDILKIQKKTMQSLLLSGIVRV